MALAMFVAAALAVTQCSAFTLPQDALPSNYTGWHVFSVSVPSEAHWKQLSQLQAQHKLSLWSESAVMNSASGADNAHAMFAVAPAHVAEVTSEISHAFGHDVHTHTNNLQSLLDAESAGGPAVGQEDPMNLLGGPQPYNLMSYPTYDLILDHLDYYDQDNLRCKHVSKFSIGFSYKGRPIVGAKFDRPNGKKDKPIVMIECGIHAREWISMATCLWMIHELSFFAGRHNALLDNYEVRILPSVNPDGYQHSKIHRFWRGNTRPNSKDSRCIGADLNRNFDIGEFCGVGTSKDPCDEEFCGEAPFSEPESQALRDAILDIKDRLDTYVSLHAFDPVTGSSLDWVYSLGVRNVHILEQPPAQNEAHNGLGFIINPEKIPQIAKETFEGLKAMILAK